MTEDGLLEARRLLDAGRPAEAAAAFAAVTRAAPRHPQAWFGLGLALMAEGRAEAAAEAFGLHLSLCPHDAGALANLAQLQRRMGRSAEAVDSLLHAAALLPGQPALYGELAMALHEDGRDEEALRAFTVALRAAPDDADLYVNLGNLFGRLLRFPESERCYRTALALRPRHAATLANLGSLLLDLGRLGEARAALEEAVAADPDDAQAQWTLALTLLSAGEFAEGFERYEWRWRLPGRAPRRFAAPEWHGQPVESLLLTAEQGMGDVIQFLRYVPRLAARGVRVVAECQAPLLPLVRRMPELDEAIPYGAPPPACDARLAIGSLPRLLGPVAADTPYLRADPERVDAWRRRLADVPGPRVGLVWAGNPAFAKEYLRRPPPQTLDRLGTVPGIAWFGLQKGEHERRDMPPWLTDLGPELADCGDTAAALTALDLVVTVDTATAHLAGALGRPGWVLLSAVPEWRWGRGGDSAPWYPSLTLFRQSRLGDWNPVVERVAAQLASYRIC